MPLTSRWHAGWWLVVQVGSNALIGLLFQRMLALRFGLSAEKSAFDIAFSIPFTVVSLSGLAMAHTVIVGFFTRFESRPVCERDAALSAMVNMAAIFIALVTLLGCLFAAPLAYVLAPGLKDDDIEVLRQLIVILLPLSVPLGLGMLLSAASFASGIPMSQELIVLAARFVVMIAVLAWPPLTASVTSIALWLVVAATLFSLVQLFVLRRFAGFRWTPMLSLVIADRRWLIGRFLGFVGVALAAQAAALYYRSMATYVSPGFVAAIGFAVSLVEPIGTAFGRVAVYVNARASRLVGSASSGRSGQVIAEVLLAGSVGLLATLVISAVAPSLIAVLYGGGRLGAPEVASIAEIASVYAWTLPGVAITWVVLSHSIAQSQYKAPTIYITGYLAQIFFLAMFDAGESGGRLVTGYLLPVWWQAVILLIVVLLHMGKPPSKTSFD